MFGLYCLFFAFVEGNQRAFTAEFVPHELYGTALGVLHMVISMATLPASLIAGLLWSYAGPSSTFIFGAAIGLIAAALLLLLDLDKEYSGPIEWGLQ